MEQGKGMIFNIQRYSVHDGYGIRTNVFFKGCPLACKWCANPESQRFYSENTITPSSCMGCMGCVQVCPTQCVTLTSWDRARCTDCRKCEQVCPTGSRKFIGQEMTVAQVAEEVLKDSAFYTASGGGATLTGGEPLAQADFAARLARELRLSGLHLAIETCGYAPWEKARPVLEQMDQILYDIKAMDSARHQAYTGVDNTLILENARKAAALGKELVIRVPTVGGYNSDVDNILATARFGAGIGASALHLLPYHRYGENKYGKVGMTYEAGDAVTPTDGEMEELRDLAAAQGIRVQVGG